MYINEYNFIRRVIVLNANTNRFMLNNSLAAVSALRKDGNILATDGKECHVHVFDINGNFSNHLCTARAYHRLRYSEDVGVFTALGCDCSPRVYCADENFNELGYTLLDTAEDDGCKTIGTLVDVSVTTVGNEHFFVGAFEKNVFLFDIGGNRLYKLCRAENCERITDFISFGSERYAMSTQKGSVRSITVSDAGQTQSAILDSKLTLRMLFEENGNVYGLFGYSYIYNRIVRIYTDGRLTLPKAIENSCFSC